MRKVLLTESQVRLIKEEVDKNDSIQKLIFTNADDVEFKKSADGIRVIPVVDGKEISNKFISIEDETIDYNGKKLHQLKINVNPQIRHLGIAQKMFEAFILRGFPTCFMYDINPELCVDSLWGEIMKNPKIRVKKLNNNGVLGILK